MQPNFDRNNDDSSRSLAQATNYCQSRPQVIKLIFKGFHKSLKSSLKVRQWRLTSLGRFPPNTRVAGLIGSHGHVWAQGLESRHEKWLFQHRWLSQCHREGMNLPLPVCCFLDFPEEKPGCLFHGAGTPPRSGSGPSPLAAEVCQVLSRLNTTITRLIISLGPAALDCGVEISCVFYLLALGWSHGATRLPRNEEEEEEEGGCLSKPICSVKEISISEE